MAAILSSAGVPSASGGRSGRVTQTPTRPERRSPAHVKFRQCGNDPVFQRADKLAHIAATGCPDPASHRRRAGPAHDRYIARRALRHARESGQARSGRRHWPKCLRYRAADVPTAKSPLALFPHDFGHPSLHRGQCFSIGRKAGKKRYFGQSRAFFQPERTL